MFIHISNGENLDKNQSANQLAALGIMLAIIIVYEIGHLFALSPLIVQSTLGFVLFFSIIFSAFRFGLIAALITAVIANIYFIYALSGPGRNITPLQDMLGREWVIALMFFIPAAIIGYLRDRINNLIQRERNARQEAEEGRLQLSKILEEMPVGVAIAKAPTGELIFSNRHLEQLMGHQVPKHESLKDYPKHTIVDENGNPLPEQHWPLYRVIKKQETIVNEEFYYQVNEDTRLRLQVKGTPIINNENQVVSGVIIVDDVTAERELLQRKDDFLSMVSHELKTPITSLKMYTQLLIKQLGSNHSYNPVEELKKIDAQTQKLHRIINNMLDLATIQLDKGVFQLQPVKITEIVHESIQDIQHSQPHRKLIFDQKVDAKILGDKDRIIQVITNLVSNAIKYSPEDAKITIATTLQDDSVVVSVQDEGIGISLHDKARIFDRFYQVDHKNGQTYPGLGLGLYFSAEIIKQHQGKLWVESKKGKGSTFYVSLPLPSTDLI